MFSRFGFSRKKSCLFFCAVLPVHHLYSHTHFFTLACGMDLPFDRTRWKISTANWYFHWDLSPTQISPLLNLSSKSLYNESWLRRSSRPLMTWPHLKEKHYHCWGHHFPSSLNRSPMVEETVSALSQGAVETSTYHQRMKVGTAKCSLTWWRRRRNSKSYSIASESKRRMIEKMWPVNRRSWII